MTTTYTITPNEAFNSLEISFEGKPSEAVREALKALRYRWHGVKKVWYGYSDESAVRTAIEKADKGEKAAPVKVAKSKANKLGVEVGDVFCMSWGYDQTNVDFFQVVELVGEQSVRVINVCPEIINRDEGLMCGDFTFNVTKELMKKDASGVFIENAKGDVKRVKGTKERPYLKMASYANAYKIPFGPRKEYVSWYS